ncbi:ribosomal RNA-processing protein 12 [Trichomonascus vanleenenianus]|uniref:mRNA-binding protein RRP12 n=1 Tax=Trichomonascus vanleenenianus TaxID=2268995 RepID=UPI003ECA52D8
MPSETRAEENAPKELQDRFLFERLDKIRAQKNSKLANQSHVALILSAVDENLEDDKAERSAAAYFVSFLALAEQAFSGKVDQQLASSAVYLLDIVAPFTSAALLKSKFPIILEKLVPALVSEDSTAALLRSSIGVLEALLLAQDVQGWQIPMTEVSPRQATSGLLQMAVDPRPKVRKRAQDAITRILANPPPSPKLEHPAGSLCAEFSLHNVKQKISEAKRSKKHDEHNADLIHALQLVRSITAANGWPMDKMEVLCETLLSISKTSDQYLIVAAFDVFEAVFKGITDGEVNGPKLNKIIDAIFDIIPSKNDVHLAPAWLAVVAQAGESYASLQPAKAFNKLPAMFSTIITFMESESDNVHVSASQCLVALATTAIPSEMLSISDKKTVQHSDKVLAQICATVLNLLHIKYIGSWKESMEVLVALFDRLRWRANPHLINALKVVGALRSQENFEGSEAADFAIAAAIRALGPEVVLECLPLNLDTNKDVRAWLLPLLRDNVQFARIGHFINYFVPLADQLQAKSEQYQGGAGENATVQKKLYSTLYDQVWSLLPRYMDVPVDLREAFTDDFAVRLGKILYAEPNSRSRVCQALKLLVESNRIHGDDSMALDDEDFLLLERLSHSEAQKNLEFISQNFATKFLTALFNVFMETSPDARGYILECMETYMSITPPEDLAKSFNEVSTALFQVIQTATPDNKQKMLSLMDIIVAMTPFLPAESLAALKGIFTNLVVREDEPLLQKKAFRIVSKLADTESGRGYISQSIGEVEQLFIGVRKKVSAPARGAMLQAVSKVVDLLPNDHLYFIPSLLPEAVLSTKDVNEKTRENAFNLLVQMGHKMKQGGVVQQAAVPDFDDDAPNTEASLNEYFTMVTAGLAGDTPHMISATITALSRVVFEFRSEISTEMLSDIAEIVSKFLEHKSREIVKSTLGFVKITCVSLPVEIVEPRLKEIIADLLVWSHEHKAHFKSKVKHIIERLIRRFGYDTIAANFPESDMKLLTNIRKSKERAKRQKKAEGEEENETGRAGRKYDNEFDRVVYGDSSDEESDSDVDMDERPSKNKSKGGDKYIVEGEDEPLDLLDNRSLAKISSSKPRQKNKPAFKESAKFAKDSRGRIIVREEDVDDAAAAAQDLKSGIDAYVNAMRQGPVKGQRNRLKYKRSSRQRDESDDEGTDNERETKSKPPSKYSRPLKKKMPKRARL